MPRDLRNSFAADRVDHRELQAIISRHFPSSGQSAPNEVIYPGTKPWALKLRFSNSDRLLKIESGPALTIETEQKIQAAIHDALLNSNGFQIFTKVLFADQPLQGSWRYEDWFRITSVPADAPRLNCLVGDHPFILEVKVARSSDPLVTSLRWSRAAREVELLLAGLLEGSIHSLPGYFHWVLLPPIEQQKIAYLQEYYSAPSIFNQDAVFSPESIPAPSVRASYLFASYGHYAGQGLAIPDSLVEAIAAYEALDIDERQRFLRACYWIQHANRMFSASFSAAFVSAVTAAESLLKSTQTICPKCGQVRFGLSSAYASWIDTYIPLDDLTTHNTAEERRFRCRLKHLYKRRSVLTHGSGLLSHDKDFVMHMTPLRNLEDQDLRTLLRVMHMGLTNWLVQRRSVEFNQDSALLVRSLTWLAAKIGTAHSLVTSLAERLAHRNISH